MRGSPRRPPGPGWAGPAGGAVAGLLGLVARVGTVRVLDQAGSAYAATCSISPEGEPTGVAFLDRPGAFAAKVRFWRGVGLPEPLPDLLRLAIKVIDAHGAGEDQDFVLTSSSATPAGRHLALPATGFLAQPFSSVMPYLVGGRLRLFAAAPHSPPIRDGGTALAEVHVAAGRGELCFDLTLAGTAGPWRRLGRLTIGELLDDREADVLRFDPWRRGPGLRPMAPIGACHRAPPAGGR